LNSGRSLFSAVEFVEEARKLSPLGYVVFAVVLREELALFE
jgi:hypothetical protein